MPGLATGLQIFDVGPNGPALRPGGCFVPPASGAACTKVPALAGLDTAYDMAVAPDGGNVYISTLRGALLNFRRQAGSGALRRRRDRMQGADGGSESAAWR
jgi:hypothetical protein